MTQPGILVRLHPNQKVLSIRRALYCAAKCDLEGCSARADFALELGHESGHGSHLLNFCRTHLELELEQPRVSAKVLLAMIEQST